MADETHDYGSPIAYAVLAPGTAVVASDSSSIGTVERVLSVAAEDVFDGIVVTTAAGPRFVDRDQIDCIFERAVVTLLTAEEARALPPPEPGAPAYVTDPGYGVGPSLHDRFRRWFGKARWHRQP